VCGTAIGRLVVHMRRIQRETAGLDDFIALGLIAVAYGVALLIGAYGFLAVFAAGVALRRIERQHTETLAPRQGAGGGTRPEGSGQEAHAPAEENDPLAVAPVRMAEDVQGFNERLERLGEVAAVVLVGAMLSNVSWRRELLWFVPLLFLVVRPAAVFISLAGSRPSALQRAFIGWFGVRGVGSIYYLAYCVHHGVEGDAARLLADVTLATVTVSIVAHGVSVTPLMKWYEARRR
jgi:NhaP-type Na+/H+ or K+/H+ antiporter